MKSDILFEYDEADIRYREVFKCVLLLSVPAIFAEIGSIVMEYIDASMVGHLGAKASGAIGLVISSTWLVGGICMAISTGFSIIIAHKVGAGKPEEAREYFRQGLFIGILIALILSVTGVLLSPTIPRLLGGKQELWQDATSYYKIYSCSIVFLYIRHMCGSALICSGNVRIPSVLNLLLCVLDVGFNYIFIQLAGFGVTGAALGTMCAEIVISLLMLIMLLKRGGVLAMKFFELLKHYRPKGHIIGDALKVGFPVGLEHMIMCIAYVMFTRMSAPLGTVAVAAHSLAITAESFCYMPAYGISRATTGLVGRAYGAGKDTLKNKIAVCACLLGVGMISVSAVIMYMAAPFMFELLSSSPEVRETGVRILRIELISEAFYGLSIVATGVLRGVRDTVVPGIMSLVSMWGVRFPLALYLVPTCGIDGIWIAMCAELIFRGIIFLLRLFRVCGRNYGKRSAE